MKKILTLGVALLVALACAFSLVACGGRHPALTQQVYDRGQSVAQATEQYLGGSMTAEQARDIVAADFEAITSAADSENEGDSLVVTYTNLIMTSLQLVVLGSDNMQNMLEQDLKTLKDVLNGRW